MQRPCGKHARKRLSSHQKLNSFESPVQLTAHEDRILRIQSPGAGRFHRRLRHPLSPPARLPCGMQPQSSRSAGHARPGQPLERNFLQAAGSRGADEGHRRRGHRWCLEAFSGLCLRLCHGVGLGIARPCQRNGSAGQDHITLRGHGHPGSPGISAGLAVTEDALPGRLWALSPF